MQLSFTMIELYSF